MDKRAVRTEVRRALAELSEDYWADASRGLSSVLVDWLNQNPEINKVALYAAMPAEIDLQMATLLMPSHEWHYPVVARGGMGFHLVSDQSTLRAGYQGVREPNPQVHPPVSADTLQVVLCPGLAFTQSGIRLGRGGGFYDRFLATVPDALKIGVCLPEQMRAELPVDDHDILMSHLLTSEGVVAVSPRNVTHV